MIVRVQREKHNQSIKGLGSKISKVQEIIVQFQEAVRSLEHENSTLKALLKTNMLKVWAHTSTTNIMKSFLNEALNYINKLNEEISTLKDDLVETANLYFKRDKEHVAFFILD